MTRDQLISLLADGAHGHIRSACYMMGQGFHESAERDIYTAVFILGCNIIYYHAFDSWKEGQVRYAA